MRKAPAAANDVLFLHTEENALPLLVNAAHPLPLAFSPAPRNLVPAMAQYPDILLQPAAARALQALLGHIGAADAIVPVSGWRSREEQAQIYHSTLLEKGEVFTKQFVALPGCSEHETGLAIDLGENKPPIDFIRPVFPAFGICGRFAEEAARFGFILRYPADKTYITGIAHEPWHFRYVGKSHALAMKRQGLCLEEYCEQTHVNNLI